MRLIRMLAGLCVLSSLAGCRWHEDGRINGVLAWDRVELISEQNEPIVRIEASEGQRLKAGDPILKQDDRMTQARLAEAEGALEQARARLAELRRGPRSERIDGARARLDGVEAEADNAVRELHRLEALKRQHLVSAEAVDAAKTRVSSSGASVQAARAALEELLHGSTAEELQQAEAVVTQTRARIDQLEVTLGRLDVRAPRDGLLDDLPFELGERPPAGKVVAVLLAGRAPYARLYVPEPLRAQLKVGSTAQVHVDGVDRVFAGHIRRIRSDASFTPYYSLTERDRSRLSYLAEVELDGEGAGDLPAGLPVRVSFPQVQP